MYGDSTGVMHPYHHNFYQDLQPFDAFWDSHNTTHSMDYDLGAEGDLFQAPVPIIEQQMVGLDPMMASMSGVVSGGHIGSNQAQKVADIELMQDEQLLSEVFCDFKKDLLANEATGTPLLSDLQIQIPVAKDDNPTFAEEKVLSHRSLLKSISAECLSSNEGIHKNPMRPNILDIHGINFEVTYGMRRSFSEGDIKTIGNDVATVIKSPLAQPRIVLNSITEARKEKLSRYRAKRTKRNFGRKIKVILSLFYLLLVFSFFFLHVAVACKLSWFSPSPKAVEWSKYACRKAVADSQPRIRGRFAKTKEIDS